MVTIKGLIMLLLMRVSDGRTMPSNNVEQTPAEDRTSAKFPINGPFGWFGAKIVCPLMVYLGPFPQLKGRMCMNTVTGLEKVLSPPPTFPPPAIPEGKDSDEDSNFEDDTGYDDYNERDPQLDYDLNYTDN